MIAAHTILKNIKNMFNYYFRSMCLTNNSESGYNSAIENYKNEPWLVLADCNSRSSMRYASIRITMTDRRTNNQLRYFYKQLKMFNGFNITSNGTGKPDVIMEPTGNYWGHYGVTAHTNDFLHCFYTSLFPFMFPTSSSSSFRSFDSYSPTKMPKTIRHWHASSGFIFT